MRFFNGSSVTWKAALGKDTQDKPYLLHNHLFLVAREQRPSLRRAVILFKASVLSREKDLDSDFQNTCTGGYSGGNGNFEEGDA
jgi:hypothetical protein